MSHSWFYLLGSFDYYISSLTFFWLLIFSIYSWFSPGIVDVSMNLSFSSTLSSFQMIFHIFIMILFCVINYNVSSSIHNLVYLSPLFHGCLPKGLSSLYFLKKPSFIDSSITFLFFILFLLQHFCMFLLVTWIYCSFPRPLKCTVHLTSFAFGM